MGWLYMKSLGGFKTPKEYLDNQFTFERNGGNITSTVLKSAVKNMRTYYAAVEHVIDGKRQVFAVVCLVRYNKRDKDGYIFGYKDMDETMGPCEAECPASILDLLTPTEAKYAIEWRAKCRAKLDRPKPKVGDTIVFDAPVKFTDGQLHSAFKLIPAWRKGGRSRLMAVNGGGLYRISNLNNRADFHIVGANEGAEQ